MGHEPGDRLGQCLVGHTELPRDGRPADAELLEVKSLGKRLSTYIPSVSNSGLTDVHPPATPPAP